MITAPFRGLALGVFLITVGMSVDLGAIVADWSRIVIAILAVVLVKAAVTGGLLRLGGARQSVAAETGFLMASPSETTLIVLAGASAVGLIDAATQQFWTVVTAVGLTITPFLARVGRHAGRRVDLQGEAELPAAEAGRVVIIGFGRVGRMIADMLAAHNRAYVAVDSVVDSVAAHRKQGFPVIFGDVARPELMDKLQLGHAAALVLTMDDPVLSVRLTKKVRALCPGLTIVARARYAGHAA